MIISLYSIYEFIQNSYHLYRHKYYYKQNYYDINDFIYLFH
jgi:hypothetical protein